MLKKPAFALANVGINARKLLSMSSLDMAARRRGCE
jgi:hypothetical protein